MANFGSFEITTAGLELEYKAQVGETLNFTKFVLGDGYYTGDIKDLTNVVNEIREENVIRLNVQTLSSTKKVSIGFNINTANITTGFYLREIGLFAEDPDGGEDILVFYGNAGDIADYIQPSGSSTVSEKLIDLEVYISNVANITAVIDTSLIYATEQALENLQTYTETQLALKSNNKKVYNIELDTTWTGATAPYTKTVSVEGILATDIVNIEPIYSSTLSTRLTEKEEYAKISMISSADGSVTITCDEEKPTIALNVRLEVLY